MTVQYKNFTIAECDRALAQYKDAIDAGKMRFWQKFTCAKCWARIQVDTPNTLFEIGHCLECGHFTDLKKDGCNYAVNFWVR